ncbi:HipA N-terminal domain-containing protein [Pelomonas sp. BJYL3]|uniref:HipA N-terminal domain-containing protein n=1 Tax=Pelomonas sp. BJYL3 TaxID=2976697 RepID=UPI002F968436
MARKRPRALALWMNGTRVGTWALPAHAPELLQYDPQWTQSPAGRPLSLSLPFTPGNQPLRGDAVRSYFENLLPDSKESPHARWGSGLACTQGVTRCPPVHA